MRGHPTLRRAAIVWLVCFGVYASTIGLRAFGASDYAGEEPHYLLTTKSLLEDHRPDLLDEYRGRAYSEFYPYTLDPHGSLTGGALNEAHGVGLPLLILPAYAAGGAKGVELFLAAIAALAVALAYGLASRVAPDPWALGAAFATGLSPPLLAYGSAVYAVLPAGAALAGAALLALRLVERPTRPAAFGCFALLGALPWLGTPYLFPGAVVAFYAVRALRVQRRRMLAIGGLEVLGFSLAFWAGLNNGLYGGLTPYAAAAPGQSPTDVSFPVGFIDRTYRLVALWIDRDYGLLRWSPVLALAFLGGWIVLRERRAGLARVIPQLRVEETAASLCLATAAVQLLVATFLAPTMFGFWFPGRYMIAGLPLMVPLVALGLRRLPRTGALLALVGVAGSVWLYVAVRWGDEGLAFDRPDAPLGPLRHVLPYFGDAPLPYVIAALIALAAALAVVVDERRWRRWRELLPRR